MKYFRLNQTVYHPVYGEGLVISTNHDFQDCKILVKFKDYNQSFREDGSDYVTNKILLSQNPIPEIVNIPLQDDYIPFTFEDRELLRGKWVRNKEFNEEFQITYLGKFKVGVETSYYSYEDLLKEFEFLDGKPCGKFA